MSVLKDEPEFNPFTSTSKIELIKALNWYNFNMSQEDSKKYALDYLSKEKPTLAAKIKTKKESEFKNYGFVLRLAKARGYVIGSNELESIITYFESLANQKEIVEVKETKPVYEKRETVKGNPLLYRFDEYTDNAILGGRKQVFEIGNNKGNIRELKRLVEATLNEIVTTDYYSDKTSKTLKPLYKTLISRCDLALLTERKNKIPKNKPVSKITEKVRFQEKCDILGLKSIHPSLVVGKTWIFVYDTDKRMLYYIEGKDLSFTGTTIRNYEQEKCWTTTIRNPAIFFGSLGDKINKTTIDSLVKKKSQNKVSPRFTQTMLILARG